MKRAKQKSPKKTVRKKPAIYSSARKKKGKPDFHHANGGATKSKETFFPEDAIPYRTHSAGALDVATPPILEIESTKKDDSFLLQLREDYEQAVLDIFD